MPGSEWNQLVAAPSATEIDAALADVRVRAVPIARRHARNRRVLRLGGVLLVAGAAFWAGDLNGRGAYRGVAGTDLPGGPEASLVPEQVRAPAWPLMRWHIASWVEVDGERMSEGDGWIEGPPGTGFTINKWTEAGLLSLRVQPTMQGGALFLIMTGSTSRPVGDAPRGSATLSRGFNQAQRLPAGKSVLLSWENGGGEGRMFIRLDGPAGPPPPDEAMWTPAAAYSLRNLRGRSVVPSNVRIAVRNIGALGLIPAYQPPEVRIER